jgi:hypothetical protein
MISRIGNVAQLLLALVEQAERALALLREVNHRPAELLRVPELAATTTTQT